LWVLGRTELKTAVITETRGGEKLLRIVWFLFLDVNMSIRFDSKIPLSLPGEMETPVCRAPLIEIYHAFQTCCSNVTLEARWRRRRYGQRVTKEESILLKGTSQRITMMGCTFNASYDGRGDRSFVDAPFFSLAFGVGFLG